MIREEPELTNIRDFTTLFYVIFRCSPPTIESDLGTLYAICNMERLLSHSRIYFLQILLLVQEQFIKRSILFAYFRVSGERNFYIRDRLFFLFVNRAETPLYGIK